MKRKDIFTILDELGSGLEELKDSLRHLGKVFGKETAAAARTARKKLPKIRRRARKQVARQVKAGVKQLRVLQGQYMAMMRRLSKVQQQQARKIRKSEGYAAALKFLSKLKAAVK